MNGSNNDQYNTDSGVNGYSYDTGGGYYSRSDTGMAQNEFSYTPVKPRKAVGKRILTAVLALMFVGAVSVTSIIGYNKIMGYDAPRNVSEDPKDNVQAPVSEQTEVQPKADKPIPTLEQLAAPEDALSIPEIITKMSPSVVGISCITTKGEMYTGSGIVLTQDGYIITNAHVIEGAQTIAVLLPTEYAEGESSDDSELTYDAELIGCDEQTDIAVLKIKKTGLTEAEIGHSSEVRVGELSIVIGNPLGLDLTNSATAGIISAKDRTITVEDRTMNVMQTDASINHGNSGGPLINAYGQVIGITSAKVTSSDVEGLGFAIPIDDALPIITDLIANGYVTGRPSLGISGKNITSAYSSYYGLPQGFRVMEINQDSCAQKAGIQINDVIIAINDTVVSNLNELNNIKNTFKPGDTITLTVYRNGRKIDLTVILDEASGDQSTPKTQENDIYDRSNDYGYYDPYDFFYGY